MTIRIVLKDGREFDYKYRGTWNLFLWSVGHYCGIRARNAFIAHDLIASMQVT